MTALQHGVLGLATAVLLLSAGGCGPKPEAALPTAGVRTGNGPAPQPAQMKTGKPSIDR